MNSLKDFSKKWVSRIASLPFLAGILAIAITYLIISSFRSQMNLQNDALEELRYKTEAYSKSLSYFYSQRLKDVTNLSQHTELKTYYENLALGMTPEYGLDASVNNIEQLFNRFIEENSLILEKDKEGQPIYKVVYLIEKNGHLLARSHEAGEPVSPPEVHLPMSLTSDHESASIQVVTNSADHTFKEYVSVPYVFKGEYVGQIAAEITDSIFFRRFIENSGYILSLDGLPIGLKQCQNCEAAGFTGEIFSSFWKNLKKGTSYSEIKAPNGASYLLAHSEIKYSPYELVKLISRHEVLGSVSPWVLLIGMSFLLVLIGIGVYVNFRNSAKRAAAERKVRVLVDNMRQSLFAISKNATIIEPVSRYSETIFGSAIAGKNLFQVLYKDLPNETSSGIATTLNTVFGEDEIQWDLMESHLPKKITHRDPTATEDRTFKIAASPIWDENQALSEILFVVEDISEFETLSKQVDTQRDEASRLSDIIQNKPELLQKFLNHLRSVIKGCLSSLQNIDPNGVSRLLNELHTMKGSARLYHLSLLSEQIHNSETELIDIKNSQSLSKEHFHKIQSELEKVGLAIEAYVTLFEQIYGPQLLKKDDFKSSALAITKLKDVIEKLKGNLPEDAYIKLQTAAAGLNFKSVAETIQSFDSMVKEISERLSKKVQFKVEGDALLPADQLHSLSDCLVHLIQNSLDHGLEPPSERLANQKSEVGELKVTVTEEQDFVKVLIADNGRGINTDKLIEIAVKRGMLDSEKTTQLSKEEALNLIFLPDLSTKASATEYSGRGIGMDAVKNIIESLNGQIVVSSIPRSGSSFEIKLKPAI
jgi:signal transduction histidine kinase